MANSTDATPKEESRSKQTAVTKSKGAEDSSKRNKSRQSDGSNDVPSHDQSLAAKAHDGITSSPRDAAEKKHTDRTRGPPAGYAMGPAGGNSVQNAHRIPKLERAGVSPNGRGPVSPFAGGRSGRGEFFGRGGCGGGKGRRSHGGRFGDDFRQGCVRGGHGGYQQPCYDRGKSKSSEVLACFLVSAFSGSCCESCVLYGIELQNRVDMPCAQSVTVIYRIRSS